MNPNNHKRLIQGISIMVTILVGVFLVWGAQKGLFTDQHVLVEYMKPFGIWAPLMFILLQAVQVVVPVVPGGIGILGGTLLFGPWWGFLYNYLGICLGSMVAFLLARKYGKKLIYQLFSEKMIAKYEKYLGYQKQFDWMFAIAMVAPLAPDDYLCYLAGTTNMSFKKFMVILLLGKPWALYAYTFGLEFIFNFIFR